MKFKRSDVVRVFEALGWGNAGSWTKERMMSKVRSLPGTVSDDEPTGDEDVDRLVAELISAVKDGDDVIELVDALDDKPVTKPAKKPANENKKTTEDAVKNDDGKPKRVPKKPVKSSLVDDLSTSDESDAKQGKKKNKTRENYTKIDDPAPSRPGIIKTIVELLENANSKTALSLDDILEKLVNAFPDREPKGMKSTVYTQVRSRLPKTRNVREKDGRYWIAK